MKEYHLEILGNDTIYALLKDEDNNYFNNYREDSYVCSGGGLLRTIKSERANMMWIVAEENMKNENVKLVGGIGDKKSNNGTQYYQQDRIYDSENIALCQSANEGFNPWYKSGLRIRKLTPKECVRLMGFSDQDYMAMKKVNSDSQIYKQCGNSIVVNVLEAIFKEML